MRARAQAPSLRSPRAFAALRTAIAAANRRSFRIVHFSAQSDHLHLIVEATDTEGLSRGASGLAIRVARRINKELARRGAVWGDRYHARALATPREVRNAIRYVLFNFRKHRPADRAPIDECSSAPWFDGFRQPRQPPSEPAPTYRPTTWLLRVGWRRSGLLALDERPASPDGLLVGTRRSRERRGRST
jgi:REP element-mobilizing transposase RayT